MGRLSAWWKGANNTQRALLTGGSLAAAISIIVVVRLSSVPDFVVLFSGLAPEDASAILEELAEAKVPYRVSRSGGSVEVPADRVGELRIRIAGKGLTGETTVGYEIFDRTNLGMTEFLQHVNYRRALEGELTRTIVSLQEVRSARVHLAIPESNVFQREKARPTASVIVELAPGAKLNQDEIRGIYALMAASVEGLEPDAVTVVDSTGRELGEGGRSGEFAASSEQLSVQQEVEEYLRTKATELLERIVGAGEVSVQVNAELSFERVERSTESYDPASAAIRSEQRITGAGPQGDSQETTLTNYELDKTVESILGAVGTIKRLSVAVLVNGSFQQNPDGTSTYAERSAAELTTLKRIVEDAVGFDAERGDSLEIANLRFAPPQSEDLGESPLPWWLFFPSMGSFLRGVLILLAIGLVAWGLRQSSTILVQAIEADRKRRERVLAIESSASESELRKEVIRDEMSTLAKDRPNEVAQVLRSWLVEEKP
jgi:flagellar M-ring protein FliF